MKTAYLATFLTGAICLPFFNRFRIAELRNGRRFA
jgi:hypothetical protein